MKVILKKGPASEHDIQTLVVFVTKTEDAKKLSLPKGDTQLNEIIARAITEKAFSGNRKETLFFRSANVGGAEHILAVGLGDSKKIDHEVLRSSAATALAALKAQKVTSAGFWVDSFAKGRDAASLVEAAAEGVMLGAYEFNDFKSKKPDEKVKKLEAIHFLTSGAPGKEMEKSLKVAEILTDNQNFARWLGDNPANILTPAEMAKQAVEKAKGTGIKCTVWDRARIKKEKFGGLLGVSLGSEEEPRFIIMEYKGAGAKKNSIYLVGKGLTFDSGGISIKPAAQMDEMRYDMCGAAAVIGAIVAIAQLKLKVNVVALVAATENMLGPMANKPGDIMVARNGKTVEILNTDAEGRLVLADALSYASEQKPTAIFDAATLTGAIVVALGNTHTGVFTRDNKLFKRIQQSADASGELVWQMPVVDDHLEDMRGLHADLANISSTKGAGSATAAAFLEQFVESGIPYAHFDIAGTAWAVSNRLTYAPKRGASGVMVRTFVELAKTYI